MSDALCLVGFLDVLLSTPVESFRCAINIFRGEKMKVALILSVVLAVSIAAAGQLKSLPDMTSAKVPTAHDAETLVLKRIIADPHDGLSATESVATRLSFTLGVDFPPFAKKGDRIWEVHRVTFAQTTNIIWINAETEAIYLLFPAKR